MASFFIPLTGLQADSTALNTIANDLSNMNTTAFKSQTTNFSNMFYQQVGETGSGNLIQMGAGTQVSSNSTDFSQGSYNTSGMSSSDMAIDGNGFFVVKDGDGGTAYTRDGAFSSDTNGNLVTSSGSTLMGYPVVNGAISTSSPLAPISVPLVGQVQLPAATQTISMTTNLDSDSTTSFPATVPVYDSLGQSHNVTITYAETTPGNWTYSAALPAKDNLSGTSTPITGTLTFNANGVLTNFTQAGLAGGASQTDGTVASGGVPAIPLDFNADGPLTDSANPINLSFNLLSSAGTPTISQVNATSTVSGITTDGNGAGTCTGFTIGSDGTVTAQYTSGTQVVGQVALANMTNLQGLSLQAGGEYQTTLASGTATIGAAGTDGLGGIQDSALEDSNVNISSEFSDLIIAQRGFEADSKAVTTFDTVAQDTINMIH